MEEAIPSCNWKAEVYSGYKAARFCIFYITSGVFVYPTGTGEYNGSLVAEE